MERYAGFHVATFYSEGPPHDKGLALSRSFQLLKEAFLPFCKSFHGYSVRRIRSLVLADGTRGADYSREYSKVSGHLNCARRMQTCRAPSGK